MKVSIDVFDVTGEKVAQILQDSLIEADTTVRLYFNALTLPAGLYSIEFRIYNCIIVTKKAIKMNPTSVLLSINNQKDLKIYPNPFNDNITISGLKAVAGNLEVINSLGQVIKHLPIQVEEKEILLQLKEIPSGLYFLRFTANDSSFSGFNKLIIKE